MAAIIARDILCFAAVLSAASGEVGSALPCSPPGYDADGVTKWHRLDSGHYRCCVDITCFKGTHAVACQEDDPSSTSCKECEGDTFLHYVTESTDMIRCNPRRSCPEMYGLIKVDNGTIIRDVECRCDLDRGYTMPGGETNPTYCFGPKDCQAGQELSPDGLCVYCKPGMFKPDGGYDRCQYWTNCETLGLRVGQYGSRTTDSACELPVTYDEFLTTSVTVDAPSDSTLVQSTNWLVVTVIVTLLLILVMVIWILMMVIAKAKSCKREHSTPSHDQPNHKPPSDPPDHKPPGDQPDHKPPGDQQDHKPPGDQPDHKPPGDQPDHKPPGDQPDYKPPGDQPDHKPPSDQIDHKPPSDQPDHKPPSDPADHKPKGDIAASKLSKESLSASFSIQSELDMKLDECDPGHEDNQTAL